jgi:hypothetical protein
MAPAGSQRAVRRRRQASAGPALAPGLAVDGKWVADSVAARGRLVVSRASLRLKQIRADLTTREAEKLGIRQQISTFTTDMGPSSSNRIHNVQLMATTSTGRSSARASPSPSTSRSAPGRPSAASAKAR